MDSNYQDEALHSELLQLCSTFDKWNDARQSQIDDAEKIRNYIFDSPKKSSAWNSNYRLPDLYELANTMKAHIWENTYSNPSSMFDVFGRDEQYIEAAKVQKEVLVNAFVDMQAEFTFDALIDDLIFIGESVAFVGWKQKTRKARRFNGLNYEVKEEIIYDSAWVNRVDPLNFVYDVGAMDFDNAQKMYRSYASPQEVIDNKLYNISPEIANELKKSTQESDNKYKEKDETPAGRIELIEIWGDVKVNDRVLKNYIIVIADRKHVIRCEDNPFIINPFVVCSLLKDYRTKRGISPLKVALELSKINTGILNKQLDALALMSNPPYIAPKGCFNGKQEVSPGAIIEYEAALMPKEPTQLRFDGAMHGWEFISFFKESIESATGIYKNMGGTPMSDNRTATEVSAVVGGQSTRMNMTVNALNSQLFIPIVEKTAEILANVKFGEESVLVKNQLVTVGDEIRQGNYKYLFGDRQAKAERKGKFKELFEVISSFVNTPIFQSINWVECFKYALEQYGIENTEIFLNENTGGIAGEGNLENVNQQYINGMPNIPY